MGPAVEDR